MHIVNIKENSEYLVSLEASISEIVLYKRLLLLADKTDITEEIVRFTSHVVQLKTHLQIQTPSVVRSILFCKK